MNLTSSGLVLELHQASPLQDPMTPDEIILLAGMREGDQRGMVIKAIGLGQSIKGVRTDFGEKISQGRAPGVFQHRKVRGM